MYTHTAAPRLRRDQRGSAPRQGLRPASRARGAPGANGPRLDTAARGLRPSSLTVLVVRVSSGSPRGANDNRSHTEDTMQHATPAAITLHRRARFAYTYKLPCTKKAPARLRPTQRPAAWAQAAEAARAAALAAHGPNAATLPQLRKVCQLLTSHTVSERERERALALLTAGCSRQQASSMISHLLPAVRTRKEAEARAFLAPLAA